MEKEGFVSIKPQYGTFVSKISVERARSICDIREILEVEAIRKAVVSMTEEQLEKLQDLFDQMDAFRDEKAEKRQFIYDADVALHNEIDLSV